MTGRKKRPGYSRQVATLLQHLHDSVLVLREHLSESISTLAKLVDRATSHVTVKQLVRIVNLGTERKHAAGLLGDGDGVTSQHLNLKTESLGISDGLGGVATRRVEERQHAKHLPWAIGLTNSNSEGTETTAGKVGSLVLEELHLFGGDVAGLEHSVGSTLDTLVANAIVGADSSDTLGHGIEGSELLGGPALRDHVPGLGVALQGENGDLVNRVKSLDVVGGSESRDSHHPVDVNALHEERLTDRKLVGGQSTSLIRAEDIDTGKRLDGSELLNDGLLLSKVGSADSQGGGSDDGQTDGNTDNEQNQDVVEQVGGVLRRASNGQVAVETSNPGDEGEEDDENQKCCSDGVHDSLEVTLVLSTLDERGSLSNERCLSTTSNDTVSLATLATSGVENDIGHVLVDGERLSSDGRLINSDDGVSNVVGSALIVLRLKLLLAGRGNVLSAELRLVLGKALHAHFVVTNETSVSRADGAFFNNYLFASQSSSGLSCEECGEW